MFDIKIARALSMATSKAEKKLIDKIDKKIAYNARHNRTDICIWVPLNMDTEVFKYITNRYSNSGYKVSLLYYGLPYKPDEVFVSGASISWK